MGIYIAVVCGFLLGLFVAYLDHHRGARHHRRKRRIAIGFLYFAPLGENMGKLVVHADSPGVSGKLSFLDGKGNQAQPASPPAWSMSNDTVLGMTVAADGLSADFAVISVGDVTVDVVAEGDLTPGVDTVHLSGDVSVLSAEIKTGNLDFTEKTA